MALVEVYTQFGCPYCTRVKRLLDQKGVAYTEIDAPNGSEARATAARRSGGRSTVPQVFVGERLLGGSDDLSRLDKAGELDALLA